MLRLARLVHLRDLGLARLTGRAAGRVRVGVVLPAGEVHDVAHLAGARAGVSGPVGLAAGRPGVGPRGLAGVLRHAIAPDIPAIDGDMAIPHGVAHVALDHGDGAAVYLGHDAHVVRRAGVVRRGVVRAVLPVVEDVVARLRHIGVVLHPRAQLLEQGDVLLAPALRRDDVGQPGGDGDGGSKGTAPCVRILHGVASGKGLVAVVQVDDLPVAPVRFLAAEIAHRDLDDLLA